MGEVHIRLDSLPDGSIYSSWFLKARNEERSVLRLFDPSAALHLNAQDEYPPSNNPSQPLPPDRVLEGRYITSSGAGSRLLTVPLEILATILKYVAEDKEALASLALVNSDCRQLSRSYQFNSVCLDYGPNAVDLLARLVEEGQERDTNHGATLAPSVGACIRRIRVKTNTDWLLKRSDLWLSRRDFQELPAEEKNQRLADANRTYFDEYIPHIGLVLRKSLPHLEYLIWEDAVLLERPFFNSLVHSSIKHLRLSKVRVLGDFEVEPPSSGSWPLQSLDIDICLEQKSVVKCQTFDHDVFGRPFRHQGLPDAARPPSQSRGVDFFRLSTSIIRLCAPTLEALKWHHSHDTLEPIPYHPELAGFDHLRVLDLGSSMKLDKNLAEALLKRSRLSELTINTQTDPEIQKCLDEIGRMQSLEMFVWNAWKLQETQSLDFLQHNTQLKKLAIPLPASTGFLDKRVVPLLASSFACLKSLCLYWADISIPESSIKAVGGIASLEQLELSAMNTANADYWPISHVLTRTHLSRLRNLRKLAFSNDTYTPAHPGLTDYAIRRPHNSDYEAAQLRPDLDGGTLEPIIHSLPDHVVWELSHRNRMLAEAEEYAATMPNLEWVYFGELPMGFTLQSGRLRAVPLRYRRDSCIRVLSEMFVNHRSV